MVFTVSMLVELFVLGTIFILKLSSKLRDTYC